MTELDTLLARLREAPPPSALAAMDVAVLEELARRSTSQTIGAGVMSLAAVLAMTVGIASTAVPNGPAEASMVSPFGVSPTLVPSALLDAH